MFDRRLIPLSFALVAAAMALAAPAVSDAACRARPDGVCQHAGASCHPPKNGTCQTVARPIPGLHSHVCLCGERGRPILLP